VSTPAGELKAEDGGERPPCASKRHPVVPVDTPGASTGTIVVAALVRGMLGIPRGIIHVRQVDYTVGNVAVRRRCNTASTTFPLEPI